MKISLQHKLLGSFVIVVALVLGGVAAGVSLLIRDYFITSKQRELTSKAFETVRVVDSYYGGQINYGQLVGFVNSIDGLLSARVWILDEQLNLLAASEEQHGAPGLHRRMGMMKKSPMGPMGMTEFDRPGGGPNAMMRRGPGMRPHDVGGLGLLQQQVEAAGNIPWSKTFYHPYYEENMLVVAVPLNRSDAETKGTVIINAPLSEYDSFLNRIYWYLGIAGVVAFFVAVFIAIYLARGIVRPLRSMQEVASAMASGDYSISARVETDDEVGDLGRSLNSLVKSLREYVSKTERTDKLRRDFVANVSHELRTPLTIMRGYNEALLDGTIDDPVHVDKYCRIMRDEAVRLERLITELLDLSQLETRTKVDETEAVSLAEIIGNLVGLFQQRCREKDVSLTAAIAESLPQIKGNGDRLTQLVLILLDNAIKYTPAGGNVLISLSASEQGQTLSISDTGIGISEEDLPFVWERFYKADKSHTRVAGGTGLGLAIAREIISMHGAEVKVDSALGVGTTITISFPLSLLPTP